MPDRYWSHNTTLLLLTVLKLYIECTVTVALVLLSLILTRLNFFTTQSFRHLAIANAIFFIYQQVGEKN